MDKLAEIIAHKRAEIAPVVARADELRAAAAGRAGFRSLHGALARDAALGLGLIAEVKRASPSAGVIAAGIDPVAQAVRYAAAGASAISVLTDERFFHGHLDFVPRIREAVAVPVLRKDFIVHEAQIHQSVVAGADAIRLIVAALGRDDYRRLLDAAHACRLEALVEVHDEAEMEIALDSPARILGVNNRNLRTFEVDLQTTCRLAAMVGEGRLLVSESGIKTPADARIVKDSGAHAVLVGEALMRADPVADLARALMRFPAAPGE